VWWLSVETGKSTLWCGGALRHHHSDFFMAGDDSGGTDWGNIVDYRKQGQHPYVLIDPCISLIFLHFLLAR
jgi:hypothetical protein